MSKQGEFHIVVLGGGFGGLTFCKRFHSPSVRVTLIDRQNHHLFQPLLYQVATAGLSANEIAQPIRSILRDRREVEVVMDSVEGVDLAAKRVRLAGRELAYDYLVIGLGGGANYFGHPEWERFAPGLKSLDDALRIRRGVLSAFERAEREEDEEERRRLMTMVVVGGGPTGVELAGAFAELANHVLVRDFRRIDPSKARVVLVEASPVVLSHLPAGLARSAQEQLQSLGVEIMTSARVLNIEEGRVSTTAGEIPAATIVWAAGVSGSPVTATLGVPLDRGGRIQVNPDCSLPGHPEVFAIGDIAALVDANGVAVPGVSPAAMQQGAFVAEIIEGELEMGEAAGPRPSFAYLDKGTMATIGRSRAVAKVGHFECSGFTAWMAWLGVHLLFLVGFRNRLAVLTQWVYSYFAYKRGARIIFGVPSPRGKDGPSAEG